VDVAREALRPDHPGAKKRRASWSVSSATNVIEKVIDQAPCPVFVV